MTSFDPRCDQFCDTLGIGEMRQNEGNKNVTMEVSSLVRTRDDTSIVTFLLPSFCLISPIPKVSQNWSQRGSNEVIFGEMPLSQEMQDSEHPSANSERAIIALSVMS